MAVVLQIYVPMEETMNTEEIIASIYNNQMPEKYLEWRDYDNEYVNPNLSYYDLDDLIYELEEEIEQ